VVYDDEFVNSLLQNHEYSIIKKVRYGEHKALPLNVVVYHAALGWVIVEIVVRTVQKRK